jgi:cyclopropane fatty-acyl-phospholipid synthase-like methyltransferase
MNDYLGENSDYWSKGYEAENVESFVFRTYGRIIKKLGFDGKGQKLLDFGCGSGATANFFYKIGFEVYGVDISEIDIETCIKRMPKLKDNFKVIPPSPNLKDDFFSTKFDIITGIQSLYYYSDTDLETRLKNLHKLLNDGGIIFATMIGNRHKFFESAVEYRDGLSLVKSKSGRYDISDYYANFIEDTDALEGKFHLFKKLNIGYYENIYVESEGRDYHFTYIGRKIN